MGASNEFISIVVPYNANEKTMQDIFQTHEINVSYLSIKVNTLLDNTRNIYYISRSMWLSAVPAIIFSIGP